MVHFWCDILEWFFLAMLPLACSLGVLRHYSLQSCFETICIAEKKKNEVNILSAVLVFSFLNKAGYVLAGWVRLLVAVRRKTLLFFEAMMPGRRFSVWAFVCVKMPTRHSCFIMPAGGSSTMSVSSWRVMDRGRKESHKSSPLRHKSNPSLFSIFCIGSLFSRFNEFAFLCLSFHLFLKSSKHICSPFCSRLSSPSTNSRLSTWNEPVTLGRMLIWVQIMLLVALWDSCNLKSSAENRLWIAAWICCNKSQTRSGPSAISQAPDRDYSVQKPWAHTSSQPKTTGCIS